MDGNHSGSSPRLGAWAPFYMDSDYRTVQVSNLATTKSGRKCFINYLNGVSPSAAAGVLTGIGNKGEHTF